jgi:hypothetical protein
MKATISRLFVAGALALVLPLPAATAEEGKPPSMHNLMERLDDAYRGFRRETDPAKALPLVREAQSAFLQSMALLPPMVEKMPAGADKDKAVATYRNMMAASYLTLTRIELAYLEGDMEAVTTLVTELRDARKAGHEKFMEEE